MGDNQSPDKKVKPARTMPMALVMFFVSIALVLITIVVSKLPGFSFVANYRDPLVSIELVVCGIILIELVGRVIMTSFTYRGMAELGYSIRAIMRGAAYIGLTIAVVSILAASPALAISIGTISGVIIGFAAQNLIGNVFAGMLLAIIRPVRVGDQIAVLGASGRVREIALIYTILDSGENWYYVPSTAMLSNTVMRKKIPGEKI